MFPRGSLGNRLLLQAVQSFLRMEGNAEVPRSVDQNGIKLVLPLSQGFIERQVQSGGSGTFSVAGINVKDFPICGTDGLSTIFTPGIFLPINNNRGPQFETRMLALELVLTFNGAGATAFNGKKMDMTLEFRDQINGSVVQTRICSLQGVFTIATGILTYRWTLGGGVRQDTQIVAPIVWNGFVPIERSLFLQLSVNDATVWPASTTVAVTGTCIQCPSGGNLLG